MSLSADLKLLLTYKDRHMSAFDPQQFLSTTFDQGVDTRYSLHQPGEYIGSIGTGEKDVSARTVTTKDGERLTFELWITTDDPKARDPGFPDQDARVRHTVWLDTNSAGSLDFSPGKNRMLGNLLMALGIQDKTGKNTRPWSPEMFKGSRLRYMVQHEPRKDNGEAQATVKQVAAV